MERLQWETISAISSAERRKNERRRFGPPTRTRGKLTWLWLKNTKTSYGAWRLTSGSWRRTSRVGFALTLGLAPKDKDPRWQKTGAAFTAPGLFVPTLLECPQGVESRQSDRLSPDRSLSQQAPDALDSLTARGPASSCSVDLEDSAMNPDQMQRRIEAREKLSYEQRKLLALEEIADALFGIRSILVTMNSDQPRRSSS